MATLAEHVQTLYHELEEQGTLETLSSGTEHLVFKGSMVQAFRNTGISQGYYTKVWRALERSGSAIVVSRGGRNASTVIVLLGEPTAESLDGLDLTGGMSSASLALRIEGVEQRLSNLETQLGGLNIKEALLEIERRLNAQGENNVKTAHGTTRS